MFNYNICNVISIETKQNKQTNQPPLLARPAPSSAQYYIGLINHCLPLNLVILFFKFI